MFSHEQIEGTSFRPERHSSNANTFSVGHNMGYMTSGCLITGDVNQDCMVHGVYAGCKYCKVTVFPFGINKYLGGDILRP